MRTAMETHAKWMDALGQQGASVTCNYSLTTAQRLLNPPGFAVLATVVVGILVFIPLKYGLFPSIFISAPLFILIVLGWLSSAATVPSANSQVTVAVKTGFIGSGSPQRFDWIPRHNVTRVNRGVLGCHVIRLISGHALVIPSSVAESADFVEFMQHLPPSKATRPQHPA